MRWYNIGIQYHSLFLSGLKPVGDQWQLEAHSIKTTFQINFIVWVSPLILLKHD